jgi:adenosylcobinamide-phosphate synthase
VARAAVESLAENFSDGVVAPIFWYCLLGLPGLCAYKAINTLDSMIGHRNPRYEAFGKCAARLDDLANLIPARIAGLFFVLAAAILPGADHRKAWRIMLCDARKHQSPNAGWQEAAVAGALDFALAGPRRYGKRLVEDHWMGNGRSKLDSDDIAKALNLYLLAGVLTAVTAVIALTIAG